MNLFQQSNSLAIIMVSTRRSKVVVRRSAKKKIKCGFIKFERKNEELRKFLIDESVNHRCALSCIEICKSMIEEHVTKHMPRTDCCIPCISSLVSRADVEITAIIERVTPVAEEMLKSTELAINKRVPPKLLEILYEIFYTLRDVYVLRRACGDALKDITLVRSSITATRVQLNTQPHNAVVSFFLFIYSFFLFIRL